MKRKGFAHAVILGGLLAFVTLFLMTFLWTCFQEPHTATPLPEGEKLISITTKEVAPSERVAPKELEQPPEIVPPFVEQPEIQPEIQLSSDLPPPVHLLSLPRVPTDVRVPLPPRKLTVSTVPYVPGEPLLFEPMVLSEEEYDMFYPVFSAPSITDDDFFADFFVVGADSTVLYEDGLYYLGLFVNEDYVGDIEVNFEDNTQAVNSSELARFIGRYITQGASNRLFGDQKDYLTIEEINARGVEATYDSTAFNIELTFGLEDMPERAVSVTSTSINRREQYGMSGAIVLKPAKFSIATSLNLYTLFDYNVSPYSLNRLTTLSASNRASIFGVGLNFSFSLSASMNQPTKFSLGAWNGFYDFVVTSHRLSFGNVGSNLTNKLSGSNATAFGWQLEKNYSYGTDQAKGNQFEYKIVLTEHSKIVISINGNELFSREYPAGTYRLKDFVFTQGANIIKIMTIPTARPDDVTIDYVDMGYDYRLLGKGDTLYGFGMVVPKEKATTTSSDAWNISLPRYDNQYDVFHLDKYTATYWQQAGITDTFTLSVDLAYSPGVFNGTLNGVLATMIGTSQLQMTLGLNDQYSRPSLDFAASHRFSGRADSKFGTLNIGANVRIPYQTVPATTPGPSTSLGGNASYSGNLTKDIRFTLSGSINQNLGDSSPSWNASFSTGFSPFKSMSLNGTISLHAEASNPYKPRMTAQITGSYSFSQKLNASATTSQQFDGESLLSGNTSSLGVSYRPSSRDSLSLSLSGVRADDPLNHALVGGWTHSGDLFSLSVRQQASNLYQRMLTTITVNTSLAFADGSFGIGRSVNEAFLLVKPVGELKRASISVARSLDASPSTLIRPLGSALYNSISTNIKNTVVVFSSGATDYSAGASFVYEITPRSRQAFKATLDIQPSYTVSGILLMSDATPYEQYSSPVYELSVNEQGQEVMTRNDALYLFTDQEGRFILSDILPGDYMFDLKVEDHWYGVRFTVPEIVAGKKDNDRVLLLETFWVKDPHLEERIIVRDAFTLEEVEEEVDVFGTELVTGYDASITLEIEDKIDEETFWKIIFPSFDEDAWNFDAHADFNFPDEDEFYYAEMLDRTDTSHQVIMIDADAMHGQPTFATKAKGEVLESSATELGFLTNEEGIPIPRQPSFVSSVVSHLEEQPIE